MELILTALLIFFLPSQLGLHFWPNFAKVSGIFIDYLSPTLLFTDLLIIPLVIIYICKLKKPIKLTKNILFLILLILINIAFSFNLLNSIFKYLRLLEYSFLALYFISHPKYLYHSLINIFPYSLIIINSLAWLQFYYQHSLNGIWYFWGERLLSLTTPGLAKISLNNFGLFLRPYSTFSHPNSFAGFILISFLILYYFYRRHQSRLLLISLIFTLITIPLTFSKTAIILESVILLVLFAKNKLVYISLLPILFLTLFISNPNSLTERLQLANTSITQIVSRPITGIGLGAFPQISNTFQPVHSIPLLMISELGVPLFIFLIILFLKIKLRIHFALEILLIWITVFVTGLVDHYWLTLPQNLLLLVIVIVLSINNRKQTG